MLIGRLSSLVVLTGIQLLLGRMLTRAEFGAFGYAVAVAAVVSAVITLGTVNALPRVLALATRHDPPETVTAIMAFELALLGGLGLGAFALFSLGSDLVDPILTSDELAVRLTSAVILLAPLEAIDRLAETFIAFSGGVRRILVRKYLIGPLLRLASLAALVVGASTFTFAVTFVALNAVGTALYLGLMVGGTGGVRFRSLGRAALGAARARIVTLLRLGGSVLVHGVLHTFIGFGGALFLGLLADTDQVAVFRAAAPFSQIIHSLSITFAIMVEPQLARLVAAGDHDGVDRLYWDAALWFTILTFPLLGLVVVNPDLVLHLAFGGRYDDGAMVLRIVALGYFVYSALGFHAQTILLFERIGLLLVADGVAAVVMVAAFVVLVPPLGAVGAALAVVAGLVCLAACSLAAVHHLGVRTIPRASLTVHGVMALGLGAGLGAADMGGWVLGLPAAVVAALVVLVVARRSLRISETLPELARLPLVGRLLDPGAASPRPAPPGSEAQP